MSESHVLNVYRQVCIDLNVKHPPKVYKCNQIFTPTLVGTFRPFIVLPNADSSESELRYIFIHEITHCSRFDIAYKWIVQIMACIHWFNPFVYFMRREIDRLCELSCDEGVIRELTAKERRSYGDTLLSIINPDRKCQAIPIISMSDDKKQIKERLGAIMKYTKKSRTTLIISLALAVVLLCAAAYAGVYTQAADDKTNYGANISNDIPVEKNSAEDDSADDNAAEIQELQPDYIVIQVDNGHKYLSTPNDTALSIDEAAAAGASYLADVFGVDTNGKTFVMSYIEDNGKAYWIGDVADQAELNKTSQVNALAFQPLNNEEESKDVTVQHTFVLDAYTGNCREYRSNFNDAEPITSYYKNHAVAEEDVWNNQESYLDIARRVAEAHLNMPISEVNLRSIGQVFFGADDAQQKEYGGKSYYTVDIDSAAPEYLIAELIATDINGSQICVRTIVGTMDVLSINIVDHFPTYVV